MSARWLPVRPDLDQLKHQAKDLLRAMRGGDASALAELAEYHPNPPAPDRAKLADAQLVLARSYQAPSWPRLVQCCRLIDAIWHDDIDTVRELVLRHPQLLHENAGIRNNNWGPPLSYAANLGRDRIIEQLHSLGATDLRHGLDRAVLQSQVGTARKLHALLGAPRPSVGALATPAYSLSVSGTELLFEFGATVFDAEGKPAAPVDVVLETDGRKPEARHRILELYAEHGFPFPDTPMMALHRGRIDLVERHLQRDPTLLQRTFSYSEIFPPELKCGQPDSCDEGLPRTPLAGATLLHVCVEFDELEIARWLLSRGMNADAPAAVDAQGFGGHTALFGAVVCYANFWMNFQGGWAHSRKPQNDDFARLLLDHGANPNAQASLRECWSNDDRTHRVAREHRNITPLAWGDLFSNKMIVSQPAMQLIAERGGRT